MELGIIQQKNISDLIE